MKDMTQETDQQTNREAASEARRAPRLTRDALVASICGFVVVAMVGAAYAAVPFYNWFCRATGFNGTTQVATAAPAAAPIARKISVRFDSNVGGRTALEVRAGADRDRDPDRQGHDGLLHRDQPVGAHHSRAGRL